MSLFSLAPVTAELRLQDITAHFPKGKVLAQGSPLQPRGGQKGGDIDPASSTLVDGTIKPKRVLIAGYQDLTSQEFEAHYHEQINKAIKTGSSFLLSDETGACRMAFEYVKSKRDVPAEDITIYRSSTSATGPNNDTSKILPSASASKSKVVTVYGGEAERLAFMNRASDTKIVWLRHGDSLKDHGCISASDVLDMRFTGPKEALRLGSEKGIRSAMAFYDEIA